MLTLSLSGKYAVTKDGHRGLANVAADVPRKGSKNQYGSCVSESLAASFQLTWKFDLMGFVRVIVGIALLYRLVI